MTADLSLTPYAHELAVLLSSAAFIDAQLLRTLRLRFLPDADAAAEARVWWSDIVEHRGGNGLTFSPEALDALRDELERRSDLVEVLEAVEKHHEGGPPLLILEEKLIATDLVDKDIERIDACLASAVAELERDRREEVFAWAERSLPRFPRRARASSAAWTLSIALHQRFGIPLVVDTAPTELKWQQLSRWLPDPRFDVPLEIFLEGEDLMVRALPSSTQPIRVPRTEPLVLVLERSGTSESVSIPSDGKRRIGGAGEAVNVANLRGQRWSALAESTQRTPQVAAASRTKHVRRFRWLHLSELQQRPTRLAFDVDDLVATATKDGPLDAVFVTGDVTMHASAREYHEAAAQLDDLMRRLPQADRVPRIFLVPGNHDLDRRAHAQSQFYAERWHDDERLREQFWAGESPFRAMVEQSFSGWTQHWKSAKGLLPGDFATTFSAGELRVGVVGLNNAFLASGGRGYGHQDLDVRQLATVCPDGADQWAESHDLRILLTHYPPAALHPRALATFEQHIAPPGRFHLHLTGSHHREPHAVARPRSLLWTKKQQSHDVGQLDVDGNELRVSIVAATSDAVPEHFTIERSDGERQDALVTSDVVPDSGVWVIVDGTDRFELPPEQVELAKQLGEALARDGHSMITFGTRGVAHVAARAFMKVLKIQGYTSGIYRLLHLVPDGEQSDFYENGRTLFPRQPDEGVVSAALHRANFALTIGSSALSNELFALSALAQVPAVAMLDGGMQRGIELPAFWQWKTSSERAAFISRYMSENIGSGRANHGSLMRSFLCRAALALDERDLDEYNQMLLRLENGPSSPGAAPELLNDTRASHRLLGYVWTRTEPADVDVLVDALQREHEAVRNFWETRTLWFALEAFRRSPRGLDAARAQSFAALFVMIQRLLTSNQRIDPGGEIKWTLARIAKEFDEHLVVRSGAMRRAQRLADRALEYETVRAEVQGKERTRRLDELVNQVADDCRDATAREARAWFASGAPGHRVIALALLQGSLDQQGVDIVIDAILRPISAFEHYRALLVGLSLIGRLTSDQQERLVAAVNAELPELRGDTGRLGIARQILRAVEHARTKPAPDFEVSGPPVATHAIREPRVWLHSRGRRGDATPEIEIVGSADILAGDLVVLFADRRPVGIYTVVSGRRNLDPETLRGRTVTAQCELALEIPPPTSNFLDANRREIDNLAKTTAERDTRALGIHDRLVTLLTKLCADDPELSLRVESLLGGSSPRDGSMPSS